MQRCVEGMRGENFPQRGLVADIRAIKFGPKAGDGRNGVQHLGAGIGQIVRNDDRVPGPQQLHARVAPDISKAAGNEQVHTQALLTP